MGFSSGELTVRNLAAQPVRMNECKLETFNSRVSDPLSQIAESNTNTSTSTDTNTNTNTNTV